MGLRLVLVAAMAVCAAAEAVAQDSISDIRAFGAHVAETVARTEPGTPPTNEKRAQLGRELQRLGQSLAPGDSGEMKLRSIARQLMLLDPSTRPATASRPTAPTRAQISLESITAMHGSRCENALGLDAVAPVRFTLAHGNDAWLYVSAQKQALQLVTKSAGPDPMLEVFGSCAANAKRLAANDDNLGLDASVRVEAAANNVYVHLINAGDTGEIALQATAAPGTINGTVRDAVTGQVVAGAEIDAFQQTQYGFYDYGTVFADSSGNYSLTPNMPGTFYIVASGYQHLVQLYPSGYCAYTGYASYNISSCDFSKARTVTVSATSSVSNINFSLSAGAKVTGQLRATDNTPVQGDVTLLTPSGTPQFTVGSDAAGHFKFDTLPPGSYLFEAFANGYSSQLYDHVTCGGPLMQDCNLSNATPLVVGTTSVSGLNFSLQQLSAFTGTVSGPSGPLQQVSIYVLDQNGNGVTYGSTDQLGHYVTAAVPVGNYYVYASATGYFDQLYSSHDCSGPCSYEVTSATLLSVGAAGQRVEADFSLDALPALTGHVTDASSGQPLANTRISVSTSANLNAYPNFGGYTDSAGNFSIFNVSAGSYYVWAIDPTHIDEIYDGIPCEVSEIYYQQPHCDLSHVTFVTVVPGTPLAPVNFALPASGSVSGHATVRATAGSNLAAYGVAVSLYDSSDTEVAVAYVDAAGNYALTDIAPGTYFAVAGPSSAYNAGEYLTQLWQNKDCPDCNVITGTPITVAQSQAVTDIDFQLMRLDAIVGRVVDPAGNPINGVVIDLFNTSDKTYASGTATDDAGYFVAPGSVGASYFVATEAGGSYIDQVYASISCPSGTAYDGKCSLSGATPISLGSGATQPHIVNFTLQIGDRVFGNGFE